MSSPRRNLFEPGQAGAYHCVSRCVLRAWLCGIDSYTGESFEHRKPIVEARIQQLGEIFAVGIHTYAVISNHLHVVLSVAARAVYNWPDEEVARRWLVLYPPKPVDFPARYVELCADPVRLTVLRERLADLSWFIKSLSEPLARMANAEDQCKGRFWEGRFKCQALLNKNAMLAACAYMDLNPIRAGIATSVTRSKHTGVLQRASARKGPCFGNTSTSATGRDYLREFSEDYPSRVHRLSRLDRSTATPGKARQNRCERAGGVEHWTMKVKAMVAATSVRLARLSN